MTLAPQRLAPPLLFRRSMNAEQPHDVNSRVAGLLRDFSLVHSMPHARFAYKRAARSIMALERDVEAIARERALREVPSIGPATERVVLEVLEHGTSPTVERAIEGSGRSADVAAARALRTNFLSRAAVLSILEQPMPGVVGREHYRGDLQTHTEWSDGSASLGQMARAAMARGHAFLGVSDHSYGLRIAGGMSMADVERQRAAIERINRRLGGCFRLVHGIEANLRADGSVDLTEDERRRFEIVLAAPHSILRRLDDQTERMLAAVSQPGVHVLAHPRGRMVTRRGVLADWDAVFERAARHDVAIEIDGDPFRQDLDHALARRALAAGCRFALDSDAHSGRELVYSECALAHARLAGIPADKVINCWPAERLLEWAAAAFERR